MPNPRTPSKVLELRGSFRKDPQRRRIDIAGKGALGVPPDHLTEGQQKAWHDIVDRAPHEMLTQTDEISLETMAVLLDRVREKHKRDDITELRQWLGQYGFTAAARAKINVAPAKPQTKFSEFKRA